MTELATASEYAKEYLPGYTGHVPSKQERFGATAGQIKREILGDRGVQPIVIQNHVKQDETARIYSSKFTPAVDKNKVVYGNMSRFAKNWVCGPNHNIRHQHVPHYTGHIKGLVSENLFAATYGNCTANAIGKKHTIGHNVEPKQRFLSQNTSQYKSKNFRRFMDKPLMQPRRDYDDYSKFINDSFVDKKQNMLNETISRERAQGADFKREHNPITTLRTYSELGKASDPQAYSFKGFNSQLHQRSQSGAITNNNERTLGSSFTDFNVKPKILESKISARSDFFNLSDGFKKIFAKDRTDQKMVVPIAGYAGHRRGDRSQNFFGKSFRESSLQSKKLQREFRSPSALV